MQRIAKVSRVFRIIFQMLLILMPLFTIISWLILPDQLRLSSSIGSIAYNPIPNDLNVPALITPMTRVLGFLINMLTVGINMSIFYFLVRLFRNYEREQIFSLTNARLIRKVGYALLVWQILRPIQTALMSLMLTWHNPPGQRELLVSFSSNNLAVILIACIVILISSVMAEAYKLQQEQEYTI